ncbi:MAG: hypothetical protein K2X11_22355 [Acetobacteraceae bacterium]|nr:hypothetical protein [Acetobacteraceae bacterium]
MASSLLTAFLLSATLNLLGSAALLLRGRLARLDRDEADRATLRAIEDLLRAEAGGRPILEGEAERIA